tara:strand:- start:11 stop:493 length:483 start_codon:yes stop_codon:yes gene_type:complete
MNLEQISNWTDIENIDQKVSAEVRSWLLEKGPITQRIKLTEEFKLQIICDEEKEVPDSELKFLKFESKKNRLREVLLHGNNTPRVYARSVIPNETIENGFRKLGELGNKPLGDILFNKNIFKKEHTQYASFKINKNTFWGRKARYTVKNYPFSVMEVFLF